MADSLWAPLSSADWSGWASDNYARVRLFKAPDQKWPANIIRDLDGAVQQHVAAMAPTYGGGRSFKMTFKGARISGDELIVYYYADPGSILWWIIGTVVILGVYDLLKTWLSNSNTEKYTGTGTPAEITALLSFNGNGLMKIVIAVIVVAGVIYLFVRYGLKR